MGADGCLARKFSEVKLSWDAMLSDEVKTLTVHVKSEPESSCKTDNSKKVFFPAQKRFGRKSTILKN